MSWFPAADEDSQILVLGSGFLGSAVSRWLRSKDIRVRAMSRTAPSAAKQSQMRIAQTILGDASDVGAVRDAMQGCTHAVFAVSSLMPGESENDPMRDMDLLLSSLTAVLSVLAEQPETSMTFLSSGGTVYGEAEQIPTPEDAPTEPIGSYGIARLAAEKFVIRHQGLHGNTVRIARLSNVYGPGQSTAHGQGVIAAALRHAREGTPMQLFGEGGVRRDFIFVDDAAECIARYALLDEAPQVLNIGSGRSDSMRSVIDTVRAVTGRRLDVLQRPARSFDVSRVELDISRLRTLIDVAPRSLRQGIADTWAASCQTANPSEDQHATENHRAMVVGG